MNISFKLCLIGREDREEDNQLFHILVHHWIAILDHLALCDFQGIKAFHPIIENNNMLFLPLNKTKTTPSLMKKNQCQVWKIAMQFGIKGSFKRMLTLSLA